MKSIKVINNKVNCPRYGKNTHIVNCEPEVCIFCCGRQSLTSENENWEYINCRYNDEMKKTKIEIKEAK